MGRGGRVETGRAGADVAGRWAMYFCAPVPPFPLPSRGKSGKRRCRLLFGNGQPTIPATSACRRPDTVCRCTMTSSERSAALRAIGSLCTPYSVLCTPQPAGQFDNIFCEQVQRDSVASHRAGISCVWVLRTEHAVRRLLRISCSAANAAIWHTAARQPADHSFWSFSLSGLLAALQAR